MYIRRTRRRTGRRTRRDVSCSVRQGLQRDVTTLLTFREHVLDSLPRLPSPPSEPPWKQPPPGRPPPWKGRYAAAPAPAPALSVGITSVDSHCLCFSNSCHPDSCYSCPCSCHCLSCSAILAFAFLALVGFSSLPVLSLFWLAPFLALPLFSLSSLSRNLSTPISFCFVDGVVTVLLSLMLLSFQLSVSCILFSSQGRFHPWMLGTYYHETPGLDG